MRKTSLWIITAAFATLLANAAHAQDIAGDWQGKLQVPGSELRLVLHIVKSDTGWNALLYDIDNSSEGTPVSSITLQNSTVKFSVDKNHVTYEGQLSADGAAISGTFNQVRGFPLDFHRATKETAWPLPDPNWGHKPIALDSKVLDRHVGRYQLSPELILNILREGDHLYAQAAGQNRLEIFPVSEKQFFARAARIEIGFTTDDHGVTTGMTLHQGAREMAGKRIVSPTPADLTARCAEIDTMTAAEFAKFPVGSVTVGVVAGNQLIWTKSYGQADMEKKIPADKDTVYRIGSITKMFTALMLEQLVEAGKVHLSDPVEKHFPEVNTVTGRYAGAPPITLIQLANHTSGLDREPQNTDTYVHGPVSDWEKTLIAALPHTRYAFEPGTHFSYSNIGFAILGAALARAAGQPYVAYASKQIFQPLGMTHTAIELTPEILPHLARGYDAGKKPDPETAEREHKTGRGYKVPNGAMYTTVGDMALFSGFLLGQGPDSVLKAASLRRNLEQSAVQADYQLSSGYTLGGFLFRRDGYVAFGHGGAVAGYRADFYVNREAGVAVIVLASAIGPGAVDTNSLALKSLDLLSK
jgi:CubicO group peptidase (beta-lactamase class C family)